MAVIERSVTAPLMRRRCTPVGGAEAMFNLPRSTGLCVLLACSGFPLSSHAQAFDLNEAWAAGG